MSGTKRLRGGRTLFEFVLEDDSGHVSCRWWNITYISRYFKVGDDVLIYGKLSKGKSPSVDHPETEIIENDEDAPVHVNRIVPVYPLTEGLSQRWLRRFMHGIVEEHTRLIDTPPYNAAGLPDRAEAVRALHFPIELDDAAAARRRLALDEFVVLQCQLRRRRNNLQSKAQALPCGGDASYTQPFLQAVGFQLTDAQRTVSMEIEADLAGKHPMRRLLQGDVAPVPPSPASQFSAPWKAAITRSDAHGNSCRATSSQFYEMATPPACSYSPAHRQPQGI